MANTNPRTVQAVCACGTVFTREVKRGRPQVWCGPCIEVPFYERATKSVNETTAVVEGEEVVADRIHNENDALDAVRPEIEARMLVLNAEHKALVAAAIKAHGVFSPEHLAASQASLKAIQDLYAELAPAKYKPGREFSEDV